MMAIIPPVNRAEAGFIKLLTATHIAAQPASSIISAKILFFILTDSGTLLVYSRLGCRNSKIRN